MNTKHTIGKSIAIFITTALVLNAIAPTLAHAESQHRDAETDPSAIQWLWIRKGNYKVRGQGAKVRFKALSIRKKRIAGEIVEMTRDTLFLRSGRKFLQVPISSITNFEVSLGQHRNMGKGYLIGLGIGLVVAGVNARMGIGPYDKVSAFYESMVFLGGPIVLLSTIGGALIKSDKWAEASPQRLNLSIAPTPEKGLRAALTFNF